MLIGQFRRMAEAGFSAYVPGSAGRRPWGSGWPFNGTGSSLHPTVVPLSRSHRMASPSPAPLRLQPGTLALQCRRGEGRGSVGPPCPVGLCPHAATSTPLRGTRAATGCANLATNAESLHFWDK